MVDLTGVKLTVCWSMQENGELGIFGYLAPLRRRWMMLFGVGIPIFMGAIFLAVTLPATYSSPAVFRFEKPAISDFQENGARRDNDNYIDQYVSKLKDSVFGIKSLAAIIERLDLYPELKGKPDAVAVKFGKDLHLNMIKEKIRDPQSGHEKDINSGFQVSYDGKTPE